MEPGVKGRDEEEKGTDMQMSLNPVVLPIDNTPIDDECRDYFPFNALPPELKRLVVSSLSIKDRYAIAGVNNSLNTIESESKYHVEELIIQERPIRVPYPWLLQAHPNAQFMVFLNNKSYSSDCIRRIAHNASVGHLRIWISGSSDFHREVYNLIKEIDIGVLNIMFLDHVLENEMVTESFIVDLTRACKELWIDWDSVPEIIHKVYKIMFDGSAKIRHFYFGIELEKCTAFLQLIGITHRDGTFFSNRNIEVYKQEVGEDDEQWNFFDGNLEMILDGEIFKEDDEGGQIDLIRHETLESLKKAKEGLERIEIDPE